MAKVNRERADRLLDADAALVRASGRLTQAVAVRLEGRDLGDVSAARDQFTAARRDFEREVGAALKREG